MYVTLFLVYYRHSLLIFYRKECIIEIIIEEKRRDDGYPKSVF